VSGLFLTSQQFIPVLAISLPSKDLNYHEVLRVGRGTVKDIAWHPNGDILAVGGGTDVWLYTSDFQDIAQLEGHTRTVTDLDWSPDGSKLASSSEDGTIRIWETQHFQKLDVLEVGADGSVSSIAWNPQGNLMIGTIQFGASGDNDIARIWDVETADVVYTLEPRGLPLRIRSVSWSPDGNLIALGVSESRITVWDAHTGQFISELEGETQGSIHSIAWSPDSQRIASSTGSDGTIRVWDVANREVIQVLNENGTLSLAWRSNTDQLISIDTFGHVHNWDIVRGQATPIFELRGDESVLSWSPNGRHLASVTSDQIVEIWDVTTGEVVVSQLDHTLPVGHVAWNPAGDLLAAADLESYAIRIWNARTAELQANLEPSFQWIVGSLVWSPDGRLLASSYPSWEFIDIWDISTGQFSDPLTINHDGQVEAFSWSPDSIQLVTVSQMDENTSVSIWDVTNGDMTSSFQDTTNGIRTVAWSPIGNQLATATWDGIIQIWDAATLTALKTLPHSKNYLDPTSLFAWSPDGTQIVGVSGSVVEKRYFLWTWNTVKDELSQPFDGYHVGIEIYDLEWNPQGDLIASVGKDNLVQIWDAATGDLLTVIDEFPAMAISWSPDGNMMAFASRDGTIRVMSLERVEGE
jgi:WD40 repeat protein